MTIIGRVFYNDDPVGLEAASVRFWTGGGDDPCTLDPDAECVLTLTTDEDGFYRIALDEDSPHWASRPCDWWSRARLPNAIQSPARRLFLDFKSPSNCRGLLVSTDLRIVGPDAVSRR